MLKLIVLLILFAGLPASCGTPKSLIEPLKYHKVSISNLGESIADPRGGTVLRYESSPVELSCKIMSVRPYDNGDIHEVGFSCLDDTGAEMVCYYGARATLEVNQIVNIQGILRGFEDTTDGYLPEVYVVSLVVLKSIPHV